jgi:hypothetical protein
MLYLLMKNWAGNCYYVTEVSMLGLFAGLIQLKMTVWRAFDQMHEGLVWLHLG